MATAEQMVWEGVRSADRPHAAAVGFDEEKRRFLVACDGAWQAASSMVAEDYLQDRAAADFAARPAAGCVVFVSDDGSMADYRKLGPLARDGVPFTLSLVRDFLNGAKREDQMSPREVDEMVGWGCEVAAHGLTHRPLLKMGEAEMRDEVEGSVGYLRGFGWEVSAFVYPFGACNTRARGLLWELGLSGCVTHGGPVVGCADRTAVPRLGFGSFMRPGLATAEEYRTLIERVHQARGLVVFMLHPEEPRHDEGQQRALVEVVAHARRLGMKIATLREAVAEYGPVWQERPRSFWQWGLDHSGRLHRMWTGGGVRQAGWSWLCGDSPLRETLWRARGRMRKMIGRKGKYEI